MTFWTTFAPRKICWEVTTVLSKGTKGDGRWMQYIPLIADSLQMLRRAGISGIRLVIYPDELTVDGKTYDWQPVEMMLDLCRKEKLLVDLCIGPFQYPNYPGIYLPSDLMQELRSKNQKPLDTVPSFAEYGMRFLSLQLQRYGNDRRVRGFHFANEWPDKQRVAGKEQIRIGISKEFMREAVQFLMQHTEKPILMNTNIDASDWLRLQMTLVPLMRRLNVQGRLGFDIYPSQETWRKALLQKVSRLLFTYSFSFSLSCRQFAPCKLFFCEVEAQPWGDGRSWYRIITSAEKPEEYVLGYSRDSLSKTMEQYILPSKTNEMSLWGADFWLSSHAMGFTWPLEQVKRIQEM